MNYTYTLLSFILSVGLFFPANLTAQNDCNLTVSYMNYGQAIFPSPLSGLCLPQNTLDVEIIYSEDIGDSLKVNNARFAATGSPQTVQLTGVPQELIVEIIGTDCFRFLDVDLPPLPSAPFMIEGDTIFCTGEILPPMRLGGHANSTFYWTNRDGSCIQSLYFSGQYNEEWTYPLTGEYAVYQYIDGKITKPLEINIVEGLPLEIIGEFEFCEGDNTRLDILVDGELPTASHSIVWKTPTGDVTDVTAINTDVEYWYMVEVTDAEGCSGTARVFVQQNDAPEVSILEHEAFCDGNTIALTAQGLNTGLANTYTYRWQIPDGTYQYGQSIEASAAGIYKVKVTNDNGCSTTESIELVEDCTGGGGTVSTENPEDNDAFALYPNPNKGTFNMVFPNAADRQVTLFSTSGQLIYNTQHSTQMIDIDVRNMSLPAGTYIVQIHEGDLMLMRKIIIL